MPYATNRTYCDADSHIMETVDWVSKHTEPALRERFPELILVKSATVPLEFIHEAVAKRHERAQKGEVHSNVVKGTKGWNAFDAFDPCERTRKDFPEEAKDKFYFQNFQALFGAAQHP